MTNSLLQQVEQCARKAGEILLSYRAQGELVRSYKSDGSFATQADLASERYLIEALRPLVPGAGFYAEESGIEQGNEFSWVIDPLDGTTNFAHGLPYFCVAIALTQHKKPILGVIYQPTTDEMFSGEVGRGAFLNGQKLLVSRETSFQKAMLVMCGADVAPILKALETRITGEWPHLRDYGAGALDIAYCAAGRFEACFYQGTKWWDVAAGMVLMTEAGGRVSTLQGGQPGPENSSFVGGGEPIFTELSELIKKTV